MFTDFQHHYSALTKEEITARLRKEIQSRLRDRYGKQPHEKISERINAEWAAIQRTDSVLDLAALLELTTWLRTNGHPFFARGGTGSSLILYLLQITQGNPLPAHIYDKNTGETMFYPEFLNGFDLSHDPNNKNLVPDGHNIPWQTLWGLEGDHRHRPALYLDINQGQEDKLLSFLERHWLRRHRPEIAPIVHSASIEFSNLNFTCSLDHETAGASFHEVKVDISCRPFALENWQEILDLPHLQEEEHTPNLPAPAYFSELIAALGLLRSTGVYNEKVGFMIDNLGMYAHQIAFSDDIFHYLLKHGFSETEAYRGMEAVRTGQGLKTYTRGMMQAYDAWILEQCHEIKYLFPKAHAVEYIFYKIRTSMG